MNILAIRGGALGDFLVTLPALTALRKRHSPARLELLTRPACGDLACHFGAADAFRSLDAAGTAPLFAEDGELLPDWQEWLAGFDLICAWMTDPDGHLRRNLERWSRGDVRVISPHTANPDIPAAGQLAAGLGLPVEPFVWKAANAARHRRRVALHPGSGSHRKNWPLENWAALLPQWATRYPTAEFLLITGEADAAAADRLPVMLEAAGIPFIHHHQEPLARLAQVLGSASLFLGHDSGVSHLAAACGLPCRLLFGPTNPAVWAPLGEDIRILQAPGGDLQRLAVEDVLDFAAEWPINPQRHEPEHRT